MRKLLAALMCVSISLLSSNLLAEESKSAKKDALAAESVEGLEVAQLMVDQLDLVDSVEVVVSHLMVPPHTTLPMHWHHGEEFIYVIDGSAVIVQKDKPDTHLSKGDVFKIPLKQIHTGRTTDESCTLVVFRVHEEGKPVRVLVEQKNGRP